MTKIINYVIPPPHENTGFGFGGGVLTLLAALGAISFSAPLSASCDKELLSNVRGVVRYSAQGARGRYSAGDKWRIDGKNPQYEWGFSPLFPATPTRQYGRTFADLLRERKALGKSTHVLDLFGSGVFIEDLISVDSITGVRIRQGPKQYGQGTGAKQKWDVVEGDLFSFLAWQKIRQNLAKRTIPVIDLVTIRPVGGLMLLEDQPGFKYAFAILLRRAYRILNPDGGEIYLQVPNKLALDVPKWMEMLRAAGLSTDSAWNSMRITRLPGSPSELPIGF